MTGQVKSRSARRRPELAITEWRLDGHVRATDGSGITAVIIVEALWVRVPSTEHLRVRWDREGQKRYRLQDGRAVKKLDDKRYEVGSVILTAL